MEHKIEPSQYQNHETVLETQVQHVDDGTFAASSDGLSSALIARLAQFFKLHDLGPTQFLLGIRISHDQAASRVELS